MANKPLKSIKYPGLSDTYTFVQIGTEAGQAADAKVVGDEISELKEGLSNAYSEIYEDTTAIPQHSTASGWRLDEETGLCAGNASYQIIKYSVIAGTRIKIISDDYFQFQNSVSVPSSGASNRIGKTYGAGTFYLIVPNDATYLIMSSLISGGSVEVYGFSSAISDIKHDLNSITPNMLSFLTLESGGNYYNPETATFGSGTLNNDGTIYSDNHSDGYSDYISVKAGDVVRCTPYSVNNALTAQLYDSSKTWVQSTRFIQTVVDDHLEITVPVGISYIRINVALGSKETAIVIINQKYDQDLSGTYGLNYKTDPFYNIDFGVNEDVEKIQTDLYIEPSKDIEWVTGFAITGGNFRTSNKDRVTKPFLLRKDETVKFNTKGDGEYLFNCIVKADNQDVVIINGYRAGTPITSITANTLTEYSYSATEDEYIILCGFNDNSTTVTFENIQAISRINELETSCQYRNGALSNKSVMFFGDSLTAASTDSITGFAEIMANSYGVDYKLFLRDRADGNLSDVDVNRIRFTNYAKDGTTNRKIASRTDSVLERVKRHVTESTNVDYVLIQCCVNDMAQANQNKGTISESYTDEFDIQTTLGALEETLRYLTTLNKNVRVGGFIPWLISWNVDNWFDDYVTLFAKWGVPLLDLRKTAGFNMYKCRDHRLKYSLTSDSYAAYDDTATYNLDDKVKYAGELYKCAQNGVVGIPPTNTDYWIAVSSESSDGTHLNNSGHYIVANKIQSFLENC